VDLLASKVDALAQQLDRLGAPSPGSQAGSSSCAIFEIGYYVIYVASEATSLLSAIPLTRELSMLMPCKTSTLAHKITPTQTHTTPVGEITQISPIATTTLFFPMPLNLNSLVFNIGPHITYLLINNLLNQSSI